MKNCILLLLLVVFWEVSYAQTKPAFASGPHVSFQREEVVFYVYEQGRSRIHLCDLEGKHIREIPYPDTGGTDFEPYWSPEGKKIAFTSQRTENDERVSAIYMMNPDGNQLKKVVELGNGLTQFGSWIKEDEFLFFHGNPKSHNNMYRYDLKENKYFPLTHTAKEKYVKPQYNPHTNKIVFTKVQKEKLQLFEMDLDGKHEKIITEGNWNEMFPIIDASFPRWVFLSDQSGHLEIYCFDFKSKQPKQITFKQEDVLFPVFFDSEHLLYCVMKESQSNIMKVNIQSGLSEPFFK